MKTMIGYNGINIFNVLSEKDFGIDSKLYLVDCGDNFYAYGTMKDLQSLFFVPVNQCGTKEKVLNHCNSIAELCRKNIQKYNKELISNKTKGWGLLIEHEQKQLNALTNFANILIT
ncbi:hypothetical protein [Clostridium tagluense]|uniref:Uncharacterized protein n=1 Tax=Clostridium tagluense TaxID=360422 RepID=A0A401USS8_9CLOT|nr:hypothetical protein [Clostridium tagluense]GCD12610.1 hypothetical protein Ctaglu_42330 [Clostridium tagluense]